MPARIDLTAPEWAAKFGRWTVLRLDTSATKPGAWWVCRCDPERGGCGAEKSVNGLILRNGQSTQCRRCSGIGNANKRGKTVIATGRAKMSARMTRSAGTRALMAAATLMPVSRTCRLEWCGEQFYGPRTAWYCSPVCHATAQRVAREGKQQAPPDPTAKKGV